ncbi:hypothetical protein AQI96_34765 [Streptomyces canus]|nr:hypothetical protein AQI96_34765 [Streptomyces canus]
MRVWYFFISVPFCAVAMYCTFAAFLTWLDRKDSQRRKNLAALSVVGVVSWAVTLFFLLL